MRPGPVGGIEVREKREGGYRNSYGKKQLVVLLNIYRNGWQAGAVATSRCVRLQTLPAVMKITQRTPISVHNAKAGDVDGAEFHHIAGPVVIHDLHRAKKENLKKKPGKKALRSAQKANKVAQRMLAIIAY